MYFNDTVPMTASVNLALTVFWDGADADAQESHVSCLWPVDETTTSRRTKSSGGGENTATGRTPWALWAVLGMVFATAWGVM
ncbi:hypothetical protein DM02DRAFT_55996 [Periconia macrospinosa]|uniref:Uncharacterized protein n=1 Tax=Periconia macrospinosa TaxID=97972 RepID=A0A2V1E9H6_9PLEO|nr:hypothetical protein DM02DRAFT_55996 [Periconia macrospinosa]